MLLQNKSRLLLLAKEPGGAERSSSDQHTIDSCVPHSPDEVVITVHIPVAKQQRPTSTHNASCSGNGVPICFPSVHLLQGAAMQGNKRGPFYEQVFDPSVNDYHIVAKARLD